MQLSQESAIAAAILFGKIQNSKFLFCYVNYLPSKYFLQILLLMLLPLLVLLKKNKTKSTVNPELR